MLDGVEKDAAPLARRANPYHFMDSTQRAEVASRVAISVQMPLAAGRHRANVGILFIRQRPMEIRGYYGNSDPVPSRLAPVEMVHSARPALHVAAAWFDRLEAARTPFLGRFLTRGGAGATEEF